MLCGDLEPWRIGVSMGYRGCEGERDEYNNDEGGRV